MKVGMEQRKMKEIKFRSFQYTKGVDVFQPSSVERGSEKQHERNPKAKLAFENGSEAIRESVADKDLKLNQSPSGCPEKELSENSTEMKIPQIVRRTSDYFLTGSWPRGILKVRSRSLSDSQMVFKVNSTPATDGYCNVFSSSLECEDEDVGEEEEEEEEPQEEEGKFDQETGEEEGEGGENSSTKKSVRFNDNVCKQVFRANASILGQRAKNQKKARQKKRSRERKLSEEGSHSSETETFTDHSDVATTEEDSAAEAEAVKRKDIPGMRSQGLRSKTQAKNSKKKGQKSSGNNNNNNNKNKNTKSNQKSFLNLSNEMVFQLDEI